MPTNGLLDTRILHHENPGWRVVSAAEALETAFERGGLRAEIQNENLVLVMMHRRIEQGLERGELSIGQLAQEDTILRVITEVTQRLEHRCSSLVVADVVGEKVAAPHDAIYRVVMPA